VSLLPPSASRQKVERQNHSAGRFAECCRRAKTFAKFYTATVSLRLQPSLLPTCSYPTAFSSPRLPAARPALPAAAAPVLRCRFRGLGFRQTLNSKPTKLSWQIRGGRNVSAPAETLCLSAVSRACGRRQKGSGRKAVRTLDRRFEEGIEDRQLGGYLSVVCLDSGASGRTA
jgi:hypothetical protein